MRHPGLSQGSSPLARGLPTTAPRPSPSTRIIPARAGFTGYPAWVRSRAPDHPRSRGVYRIGVVLRRWLRGSSPLARGLLEVVVTAPDLARIIPARAGFTATGSANSRTPGDHPRSRGVYEFPSILTAWNAGSSPLARGLQHGLRLARVLLGIIPARAGFTLEDPWNPNDESPYQTAFTFTADLALAPQSSDSAAVAQRSTRPPSEA